LRIYIIRHGETIANKDQIFQGWSDWPLNENGIKLAELTAEHFKDVKFDICFSSSLKRAKQTAEIMVKGSANPNTPIIIDDRIKEINGGIYEGFSLKGKMKPIDVFTFVSFLKFPHLALRFKNGESIRDVEKRSQNFLNELAKKDYETVLVSTHGCCMRAMLNKLYDNPSVFWRGQVPFNCAVNIVDVVDGKMNLITKDKDKIYYDEKYCEDLFESTKARFK